jgi:serine/threonine-protein kinase RsbW
MFGSYPSHPVLTAAGLPRAYSRNRLWTRSLHHRVLRPREIDLRLRLPRATWTVPLARGLVRRILGHRLVGEDCRAAVQIALCEACGNAVRHAAPATHYDLRLRVQDATCVVEVADTGTGFAFDPGAVMPPADAVSGRGLAIIARVTDQLEVQRRHPSGALLRFVKHLTA